MSIPQLAVSAFAEWIQTQVKEREAYNARAYGPSKTTTETEAEKEPVTIPPVYVCILGHSMGGLVGKKKMAEGCLSNSRQGEFFFDNRTSKGTHASRTFFSR